jgi:hypothetical protein
MSSKKDKSGSDPREIEKLTNSIASRIEIEFLDTTNFLDLLSANLIAVFPNKVDIEFKNQKSIGPTLNFADEFKVGSFTIDLDNIRLKAILKKGEEFEFLISKRKSKDSTLAKDLTFEEFKYELSSLIASQIKKNEFLAKSIKALFGTN